MIIRNGKVFQKDGSFRIQDIFIKDHKIVSSLEEITDDKEIDAAGLYVLPGLVDIHSHGAVGHDFSDADADGLVRILEFEKSRGITSYCPTTMTLSEEQTEKILRTVLPSMKCGKGASIVGVNMEGPFLDEGKKGAHVADYILPPDVKFFWKMNGICGNLVKLITIAPNVEGAMEFIQNVKEEVCVSLGHTRADYDTAGQAMKAGAHHVTHLFNAMQPYSHREPGLVGAAMDDPDCMVELICDGIHIHPSVIRSVFRMFGKDRVILISDSMRAAGMEDGTYELGGQEVTVKGRLATLKDGTIAGSVSNLFDCLKTAVSFGIPLEHAVLAASYNPAKSIGLEKSIGAVEPGMEADLLLVSEELTLLDVI